MRSTPNVRKLMIRVSIDGVERTIDQVTPSWLREEIESRRNAGKNVCIRVTIKSGSLDLILATPACASGGGGGGRAPNSDEKKLFELWTKRGMDSNDFNVGQLNAFLNEIKKA
jgi:hypothetical protein